MAEHYQKSPDQISEEELREYFLYVKNVKKWSRLEAMVASRTRHQNPTSLIRWLKN